MIDVIERLPSYDDLSMWQYCENLKAVVTQTKESKI